jgi:excisionase family DNA binding protein
MTVVADVHLHPRLRAPDVQVQPVVIQPLFTKQTACEYLAVSSSTLDRLVRTGKLRALRIGGQIRFRPNDVEDYLESTAIARS